MNNDFKIGFSFATVAGLLSSNEKDDVFDAINGSYGNNGMEILVNAEAVYPPDR